MDWPADDMSDFAARDVTFDGVTRRVLVSGTGPAVLVMAEMPGVGPQVLGFARWLRDVRLAMLR